MTELASGTYPTSKAGATALWRLSSAKMIQFPWDGRVRHTITRMICRSVRRASSDAMKPCDRFRISLSVERIVTIVGAGGVGKTSVAISVAAAVRSSFDGLVRFIDLGSLSNSLQVPSALASALGISVASNDPIPALVAFLRTRRMLIVLDSCEHVIDAAAELAHRILNGAPSVRILATSREALRVENERVYRLEPLEYPPSGVDLTTGDVLAFPAVRLFVERFAATRYGFEIGHSEAHLVAEICRRLDGLALAIEMAAGRAGLVGVHETAAQLGNWFNSQLHGWRTAAPRNQTLRSTFDWSFDLLDPWERKVLRKLAIFVGTFELEAVRSVATGDHSEREQVVEAMANLVAKSLVMVIFGPTRTRYRLLDTTCAYAHEKLVDSGEHHLTARRHAEHYLSISARTTLARERVGVTSWLTEFSLELGNLRSSLDWVFSENGDANIGLALSAEALGSMFELSLTEECRWRAEKALSVLAAYPTSEIRIEMGLRIQLGAALMYTRGPLPQTKATWEIALEIACELGNWGAEARALWGLWTSFIYCGEPRRALYYAEKFRQVGVDRDNLHILVLGDRIVGVSFHYLGQQPTARVYLERMLAEYRPVFQNNTTPGATIDHGLMARSTLARVLWLQGSADYALCVLADALDGVYARDHAISTCYFIFEAAFPIALMVGDLGVAERELKVLEELADRHALVIWQAGGRCIRLALEAALGAAIPVPRIRSALLDVRAVGYTVNLAWWCGVMAEARSGDNELEARLTIVEEALAECNLSGEQWITPELLRVRGELKALMPSQDAEPSAQDDFLVALDLARAQGAKAWELRVATSLASLWQRQQRGPEARVLLGGVLDQFDEGFGTADLVKAIRLLDAMKEGVAP